MCLLPFNQRKVVVNNTLQRLTIFLTPRARILFYEMNKKICVLIFHALCLVKLVSSYSVQSPIDELTNLKEEEPTACFDGHCGISKYIYLREHYRGLFHSGEDLTMLDRVSNTATARPVYEDSEKLKPHVDDDGSICCSTHIQHKINTTLTNIHGESLSIIHLTGNTEPNYQYIPHASCVRTGSCPGECVIENKIMSLLALNASQSLIFGFFEIPGYCSCKNLGSYKNDALTER